MLAGMSFATSLQLTGMLTKGHDFRKFLMAAGMTSLISLPFLPMVHADPVSVGLSLGAGCLLGLTDIPFYMSFRHLSALTISIAGQTMPVFVLISGWLILGKEMSFNHMISFVLILSGSLLAALRKDGGKDSTKGVLLFFACISIASLFHVANSYVTNDRHISGLQVAILNRAGMLIACVLMLATRFRRGMLELFKTREQSKFYRNNMFSVVFLGLVVLSVSLKPAELNPSIVNIVYYGTCQVCLFAYSLAKKEPVGRKAIGAVMAFAGLIWLAAQ